MTTELTLDNELHYTSNDDNNKERPTYKTNNERWPWWLWHWWTCLLCLLCPITNSGSLTPSSVMSSGEVKCSENCRGRTRDHPSWNACNLILIFAQQKSSCSSDDVPATGTIITVMSRVQLRCFWWLVRKAACKIRSHKNTKVGVVQIK